MITAMACAIGLHIGSYHLERNKGFQEFNPGIYANCDGYTLGTYKNSENRQSSYIGYTKEFKYIDVTAGVITGYKRGTVPMLIPTIKLPYKFRLAIIPVYSPAIHLMKEF